MFVSMRYGMINPSGGSGGTSDLTQLQTMGRVSPSRAGFGEL